MIVNHLIKITKSKYKKDKLFQMRIQTFKNNKFQIQNSKVFLFCLTRAYFESKNCKSELRYAINVCKKPIVFLMLERLELINLDDVGFLLNSYIYVQGYKSKPLDAWPTNYFDEIRKNIENVMPVIKMKIFIFLILKF